MNPIRTVFFGTPSFVCTPLEALVSDSRFMVVSVVTQPEKPVGRDSVPQSSPVAHAARHHSIPILTPDTLRDSAAIQALGNLEADLFVVDAYGKILPREVLDLPRHGCVNLHPSLLPKYRGATPVPFTLLNGETGTGMTFMRMSEGMDEGDILSVIPTEVLSDDDTPALLERLNHLAADQIGDILTDYIEGRLTPIPQDHDRATYSTLLTKEHGRIDWASDNALQIERKLRAFTPWPGLWTTWEGKRIKFLEAELDPSPPPPLPREAIPGTIILPDHLQTVEGLLRLITVQPEGKKPMPFTQFLKGIRANTVRFG